VAGELRQLPRHQPAPVLVPQFRQKKRDAEAREILGHCFAPPRSSAWTAMT